jgi:putative endonuclease
MLKIDVSSKTTGDHGESLACEFLRTQGYKILERNFRIRGGEIDIVASAPNGDLVFVEVKTRYTYEFGNPADSITPWKVRFLIRAAQFYLLKNKKENDPYRIDVITVDFVNSKEHPEIEQIKNITN